MITKEQAQTEREFHYGQCFVEVDPRGEERLTVENWRANGKCHIWKPRPDEWILPIKYDLYGYGTLNWQNADQFHLASECEPMVLKSSGPVTWRKALGLARRRRFWGQFRRWLLIGSTRRSVKAGRQLFDDLRGPGHRTFGGH